MSSPRKQVTLKDWFDGYKPTQIWVEPTHRRVGLFFDEHPARGSALHILGLIDTSKYALGEQVPISDLPDGIRQPFDELQHVVQREIRRRGLGVTSLESGLVVTDSHFHVIGYRPGNDGGAPGSVYESGRTQNPMLLMPPEAMAMKRMQFDLTAIGPLAVEVFRGADWSVLDIPRHP